MGSWSIVAQHKAQLEWYNQAKLHGLQQGLLDDHAQSTGCKLQAHPNCVACLNPAHMLSACHFVVLGIKASNHGAAITGTEASTWGPMDDELPLSFEGLCVLVFFAHLVA